MEFQSVWVLRLIVLVELEFWYRGSSSVTKNTTIKRLRSMVIDHCQMPFGLCLMGFIQ